MKMLIEVAVGAVGAGGGRCGEVQKESGKEINRQEVIITRQELNSVYTYSLVSSSQHL